MAPSAFGHNAGPTLDSRISEPDEDELRPGLQGNCQIHSGIGEARYRIEIVDQACNSGIGQAGETQKIGPDFEISNRIDSLKLRDVEMEGVCPTPADEQVVRLSDCNQLVIASAPVEKTRTN